MEEYDVLDENPVFPENEGAPLRKLDYLGYAPCPIRSEMQRRMNLFFLENENIHGKIEWYSPGGCAHSGSDDPYDLIWKSDNASDMAGVVSDGGSSDYFRPDGHKRWVDTGIFGDIEKADLKIRPEFAEAGIEDPLKAFHLYAAFPSVILVDKKKLGDKPVPKSYKDLLDPIYEGEITLAGHEGDEVSDLFLFNCWKNFGDEGLKTLAKSCKNFWSPAKMVKSAGSTNPEGTGIYLLNYFFAKGHRHEDVVEIVWPEEGAWFNPLLIMAKKDRRPVSQLVIDFMFGEDWAEYLNQMGFPSIYEFPGQKPLPGKLSWIGWDFIREHDLDKLSEELQTLFQKAKESCS